MEKSLREKGSRCGGRKLSEKLALQQRAEGNVQMRQVHMGNKSCLCGLPWPLVPGASISPLWNNLCEIEAVYRQPLWPWLESLTPVSRI